MASHCSCLHEYLVNVDGSNNKTGHFDDKRKPFAYSDFIFGQYYSLYNFVIVIANQDSTSSRLSRI
jgi:hypothetical protein